MARILADAAMLAARLEEARAGGPVSTYPAGSLPAIAEKWEASWTLDHPGLRTQEFYRKSLRPLIAWSHSVRHPPLAKLTLPVFYKFLARYDDRPAQRGALKRTFSALCSFALVQGDIPAHPLGVVPRLRRRTTAKRKVVPWTVADVDLYAKVAREIGWPGGARMLRLMWETSADATDVIKWRRPENFRDNARPAILYTRGKTGEEPPPTPISRALAEELRTCGEIFFVTDPMGRPYKPDDLRSDNQRSGHFRKLRDAAVAAGGRHLVLDHLRHSAVTDALEKGARKEHVPSLTAHRGTEMIEQVYAQFTEAQVLAVQRARGIVE